MYNDTNTPQQAKAKRIIRAALAAGLIVSVSDGEGGYELTCSTDYSAILDAVGNMDMDELLFRTAQGMNAGWMLWVWEFGGAPDELAADYSANATMEALANA